MTPQQKNLHPIFMKKGLSNIKEESDIYYALEGENSTIIKNNISGSCVTKHLSQKLSSSNALNLPSAQINNTTVVQNKKGLWMILNIFIKLI